MVVKLHLNLFYYKQNSQKALDELIFVYNKISSLGYEICLNLSNTSLYTNDELSHVIYTVCVLNNDSNNK